MLDTPEIVEVPARSTAVIHLNVSRTAIGGVMGAGLGELMAGLAAQSVQPAGPRFARYFRVDPLAFDLEIGVPVQGQVERTGRLEPGRLPGGRVALSVYRGPYDGLHSAWGELSRWVRTKGFETRPGQWESYLIGPEQVSDPTAWKTELAIPLEE
jgi:effector-binding domain-containing protein